VFRRQKNAVVWVVSVLMLAAGTSVAEAPRRPRIRDLGVEPGVLPPGPNNAITDVAGVEVGHRTLVEGESIRTGVTAILPHGGNLFRLKVPAAVYVGNGFGKAAGFLQVRELGNIETPIILTNTLNVGTAVEAVVRWTVAQPDNEDVRSVNAVVGETNDGFLNDIRGLHVTAKDVVAAIEAAAPGPVVEGSIGAGTGTRAFCWKGGIGTASRVLPADHGGYTVGALVQSNFGGVLAIDGAPVGERLGCVPFGLATGKPSVPTGADPRGDGSCMVVLATDAPLSARNLERMAARAILGLARTGSSMSNGSGDFVISFSTRNRERDEPAARERTTTVVENDAMSPLFLATVEAVEEAVYNSLLKATTVTGIDGHTVEAIPVDALREILTETSPSRP
jgi:D-aminopeptidase